MAIPFLFETVDDGAGGAVHGELSLALDKGGNPRIAYARASGQIMLARRDGGVWTREPVPGGLVLLDGIRICLAIDSQGNPHLAYRNPPDAHLFHAVKSVDNWTLTEVATRLTSDHRAGGVSGLALVVHPGQLIPELRDTPHFAYGDLGSGGLGYARLGSEPSPITVEVEDSADSRPLTFGFPAMAFDPETEEIHIAYVGILTQGGPAPFVSVRRKKIPDPLKGTVSALTLIEGSTSINVLSPTSVARTGSATCLSYFDFANKTLKAWFASAEIPDGLIQTVESGVNSGKTIALSAAANRGQFRVAYADANAIKLASRSRSGAWTVEVVDSMSGVLPSLAYDNLGTASLAYEQGGQLKYAHRPEWSMKLVVVDGLGLGALRLTLRRLVEFIGNCADGYRGTLVERRLRSWAASLVGRMRALSHALSSIAVTDPSTPGIQDFPAGRNPASMALANGFGYSANGPSGTSTGSLSMYRVGPGPALSRVDLDPSTSAIDDLPAGTSPAGVAIAVQTEACRLSFFRVCLRNAFGYAVNSGSNDVSAFEPFDSANGPMIRQAPFPPALARRRPAGIAILGGRSRVRIESKRAFVADTGLTDEGVVWSYDVNP